MFMLKKSFITGFYKVKENRVNNLQIMKLDRIVTKSTKDLTSTIYFRNASFDIYQKTMATLLQNLKQIKTQAQTMTSSFFNFSNFDLCQYDAYDQNMSYEAQNMTQYSTKDTNCIFTEAPNEDSMTPVSRSKKNCSTPFQSSFQCNFQFEHIEACDKKIQNFIESISACSEKIQKETLRMKILQGEHNGFISTEQILDSNHCGIEESEKQKFILDLQFERKLKDFLDEICRKFVPEVAGELISVANFIWLQYLKVMDERFSESELINWGKNLMENKFQQYIKLLEKTKEICFENDKAQVFPNFDEAIKEFMNYFFVTVALVIEQFFENPFSHEGKSETNSFKRANSEEGYLSFDQISELSQDIYGGKKLKF